MLGLHDGLFLSGASKTSVLMKRIWVTDSLVSSLHFIYFSRWNGRGKGERIVRVPVRSGQGL